jgi:hypothetical protein
MGLTAVLAVLCFLGGGTSLAWGGWQYNESSTRFAGKSRVVTRDKAVIFWQGMKLRKDHRDGTVEIFRLDQDRYWEVESSTRTYRELPLVPVAQGTGELPRELAEALAQLTQEERQLLEKYLPSRSNAAETNAVRIVPGTETAIVSGHMCQKFQARYRNWHTTLWITNQLSLLPEDQAFYRELAKRTIHREGLEDWYIWAEVLSQVGGFAMKQEYLLESAAGTVRTLVLVEDLIETNVPDSVFQLPAGMSATDE